MYQKKNPMGLIMGGMFVLILFFVFIVLIVFTFKNSKKLVCTSNDHKIKILYNEKELLGYSTKNIYYDFKKEGKKTKKLGIDDYIKEYKNYFLGQMRGSCKIVSREKD